MFSRFLESSGGKTLALLLLLCSCIPSFAQHQLRFTPYHASGIYKLGEVAGWRVTSTPATTTLHYSYTVRTNNTDVIKSGPLDMTSGAAAIEVHISQPAMIFVEVVADPQPDSPETKATATTAPQAADPKAQHTVEADLGAAIAPTELKPSAPRPSDFDAFWQARLKQLAAVPLDPQLAPVAGDHDGVSLYTVKLASVDSHVQGYLAVPASPGKHPALILYQYAGVYKLRPEGVVAHAAEGWLTLDVDSHDIPPTADTGVPTEYYKIGDRDREKSYFLDMYLRDTRAIDYIQSLPDWDGKTIVLAGTSMGGQQSVVTAGLNPGRVTAVIVNEPSGADTNGNLHGRKAGYPYWDSTDPDAMKTALYFDPVNFASLIKAKIIMAVGFLDTSAPPVGLWTAFNQIAAPKEIIPMIESAHNNKTPDKQANFLTRSKEALEILRQGVPLVMEPLAQPD